MARYSAVVASRLDSAAAFAYMAAFEHVTEWDESAIEARRLDDGPVRVGSAFHVVSRFAGRSIPLRYEVVEFDDGHRFTVEATTAAITSRDTITVRSTPSGATVAYDAVLAPRGLWVLAGPLLQVLFTRLGQRAVRGLERALNAPT